MEAISSFEITIFFLLIFLSGFFSSVETAMHSLSKITIKKILSEGGLSGKILGVWTGNQDQFLSAIYFGNNILKVSASVLAASIAIDFARFHGLYEPYALGISILISTLFFLIIGEVAPKTVAQHSPEKTFLILAAPINFTLTLLRPVSAFFSWISRFVVWLLGSSLSRKNLNVTEEEIRAIVEAGEQDGAIEEDEKQMIHSIIELGDTTAKEIMVPRVDMICVDVETPMQEILDIMGREKLSRIPVYEHSIDTIVGILHIKNVMNFWRKNIQDMTAIEFITMPYFVPETKKVDELLREFQSKHMQMAIVVDEYGGTAGLITMEDVVEEIVGEITDEYDDHGPMIRKQDDGSYLIDSKVEIGALNEQLGLQIPSGDYHTVGGLIMWIVRRVPKKNEVVTYDNLKFTVMEADRKRVHKVVLSF